MCDPDCVACTGAPTELPTPPVGSAPGVVVTVTLSGGRLIVSRFFARHWERVRHARADRTWHVLHRT